ncbi:MAG: AMP-binding protein [Flavobacteriaceae bacterium]|jgi:O-succinylbenzoic acid--CoA ligase
MTTPDFTKIHNRFKLNGFHYSREELKMVALSFIKEGDQFEQFMGDFLMDWLSPSPTIWIETSGTTSQPKRMKFEKQALINSALLTGDFFKVGVGDRALHCLPANFIAGKMMLIRALFLGFSLDMVSPSSRPMTNLKKRYHFAAMTPMQAWNSLGRLAQIDTLIVGGGVISKPLREALMELPGNVFETYGMTETLSHIAFRRIEDPISEFTLLPKFSIAQDNRGCMVINAPHLSIQNLVTNDNVEILSKTQFRLLGRIDNVINTGGVKLQPEQIEMKLSSSFPTHFFVGSLPHEVLGEEVVLALESDQEFELDKLGNILKTHPDLTKIERPKAILVYDRFKRTFSGKIKRQKVLKSTFVKRLDL